jgi:hypothetical protein
VAPIRLSISAGSLSLDATAMPALFFSNSIGLAPWKTEKTTWPEPSARHHGRTRCCFSICRRSSPLPAQRWVLRTYEASARRAFCSTRRSMSLARLLATGSWLRAGTVVNVRFFRIGMIYPHDVSGDRIIFMYEN